MKFHANVASMVQSFNALDTTATRITSSANNTRDMMEMKEEQHQFDAQIPAIQTYDEMIGTLLDVKA